jgi:protein phosphatase PTC7
MGRLRLETGHSMIAHPGKKNGGEDACFVHEGATHSAIGVADGVGGWASRGIDAGIYAREACAARPPVCLSL